MSYPAGTILDPSGNPVVSDASVQQDYDAATAGVRLGDLGLSSSGPSESVTRSMVSVRKRSRDLERNNPIVKGVIDS